MTKKEMIIKGLCVNHSAKMEGMVSFSTSTETNSFCNKMRCIDGSICQKCFAHRMSLRLGSKFIDKYKNNDWIKTYILQDDEIPFLNVAYFRFEAFGELETETQLNNYLTIARKNPHCRFALWTKRVDLLKNLGCKPKNVNIIVSSPMTNKQVDLDALPSVVDGVFTVYDKKFAADHDVKINCGGKKCINCLKCYKKHSKKIIVNELVK